jgi:hypothetical protein
MASKGSERSAVAEDEAIRYKQAAEAALGQLDWCISYLRGISEFELAAGIETNETWIRRKLMREPIS